MMTTTATKAKPRKKPPIVPAEPSALKTTCFDWQAGRDGMFGRKWGWGHVHLPPTIGVQDLHDYPQIWRLIQGDPYKALQRFDHVLIIAYDDTWCVEALVTYADRAKVKLHFKAVITLDSDTSQTWEDDTHRVAWAGMGYGVFNKRTGERVEALGIHERVEWAKAAYYASKPRVVS